MNKLHAAASFGLGYWHADLVLAQVLCVVESSWVGVAAKLGRSHVAFWLGAMLLYYIPLAAVVIYLNRLMPLQGGLYQWAKAGFNQFVGFLIGWNLWVYAVVLVGAILFTVPTDIGYMIGPAGAWIPASRTATLRSRWWPPEAWPLANGCTTPAAS